MISCKNFSLALGIILLTAEPAMAAKPSLQFSPAETVITENQTLKITVEMDTAGFDAGGAGAKIIFDPNYLKATQITPGPIFTDYPALITDNIGGRLTISGISAAINNLYNGRGNFAEIKFLALKTGTTEISFEFEPENTTDSNIAVTFGNGDVLAQVNQAKITINPQGDDGPTDDDEAAADEPQADQSKMTLGKMIDNWIKTVKLQFQLFFPDQNSRLGRPESNISSATSPIVRQTPITDPISKQPENLSDQPDKNFFVLAASLIAVSFVGIVTMILLLFRK